MLPGSGEYALATTPVRFDQGAGRVEMANVNSPSGRADFPTALDQMAVDLPECDHVSLVVSWFGDDLRCGSCTVRPLVEQAERDGSMPWSVAGVDRAAVAAVISRLSVLAAANADTVESIEINPLLARADGAVALDALILPVEGA